MTVMLSFPDLTSLTTVVAADFQDAPDGMTIVRCLIAAFVILAVGFGVFQFRRMRQRLNLLDEETRARRAIERELEEDLCGVGASPMNPAASKQKKDPWES